MAKQISHFSVLSITSQIKFIYFYVIQNINFIYIKSIFPAVLVGYICDIKEIVIVSSEDFPDIEVLIQKLLYS